MMNTQRCDTCGAPAELEYAEGYGWLCSSCHEQYRQISLCWEDIPEESDIWPTQ